MEKGHEGLRQEVGKRPEPRAETGAGKEGLADHAPGFSRGRAGGKGFRQRAKERREDVHSLPEKGAILISAPFPKMGIFRCCPFG